MAKFEKLQGLVSDGLPDVWWVSVDKKVNENTKTLPEIKEFALKENYKKLQVLNAVISNPNQWIKLSKPIDKSKPPPPPQNILVRLIKSSAKFLSLISVSILMLFGFKNIPNRFQCHPNRQNPSHLLKDAVLLLMDSVLLLALFLRANKSQIS